MQKRILYSFLMLLVFTIVTTAQWEKLPLYGGHATKFVQSKFNQNEIFALTSRSGLFYSSNAGLSWESKNGLNNEITGLSIFDLEVTNNNSLFIVTQDDETGERKFYSSTNFGVSWEVLPPPEQTGASIYSDFESLSDGTLYLFTCPELFKSTDYGINWLKIPIPAITNQGTRYFYLNDINPKQIMISGYNGILVTSTDNGMNWNIANSFPASSIVYRPKEFIEKGQLYYSTWVHSSVGNNYFISTDSGRVWIQRNSNSLLGNITSPKIIPLDSSHVFTVILNTLYFTTDAGLTWQKREFTDQKIWDVLILNGVFLGSFNTIGIQRSNDSGVTWKSSTSGFASFYEIDFSLLDSSTCFAIVEDGGSELKQTTDEGMTWTTLYNIGRMTQLQTVHLPEIRYYLIQNDNTLISGKIGQKIPDTLLVWQPANTPPLPIQYVHFRISPIDEQKMFLMIYDSLGRRILYSSDAGKSWQQILKTQYAYSYFILLPSLMNSNRIFGSAGPQLSNQTAGLGLWRCDNIGDSWNLMLNVDPLSSMCNFKDDNLFFANRFLISTDLGVSWQKNDAGIDNSHKGPSFIPFSSNGYLFTAHDTVMYQYSRNRWTIIKERSGLKTTKSTPLYIKENNNAIYSSYQYDGLYRLRNGIVSVTNNTPINNSIELSQNYPNPFRDNTTIDFVLPTENDVAITIYDILGRKLKQYQFNNVTQGIHHILISRNDLYDNSLNYGIYIYQLSTQTNIVSKIMIILK